MHGEIGGQALAALVQLAQHAPGAGGRHQHDAGARGELERAVEQVEPVREDDRTHAGGGSRQLRPRARDGLVGQQHRQCIRAAQRLGGRGDREPVRTGARLGGPARPRADAHLLARVAQVARVRLALVAVAQHDDDAEQ